MLPRLFTLQLGSPIVAVLCLLLVNAHGQASELTPNGDLKLERSHREHLSNNRASIALPRQPSPWTEERTAQGAVIYRFFDPIEDLDPAIAPDTRLSALCRAGLFGQQIPHRLRAVDGDKRVFDLAIGTGGTKSNLHDPLGRANADWIYLFDKENTGRCQVWAGSIRAARVFAGLDVNGRPVAAE